MIFVISSGPGGALGLHPDLDTGHIDPGWIDLHL